MSTLKEIIDQVNKDIMSGKVKPEVLDCMQGERSRQQYALEFNGSFYCMHQEMYCPMQEDTGNTNPECNLEYYEAMIDNYNPVLIRVIGFGDRGYREMDSGDKDDS